MMRIVRCHQSLIRNFKDCEMSSGFALILISLVVFIDTCTEFYVVMKADNLKTSLNYGMSSLLVNLAVLYPYHTGQRIADQNDILRQHLSNLPWIDKPKWFKNTLHIMMIRANVDIVMKPFGVHYLNHVSFKNMIRVSSSFGNFLYNTRLEKS
ncbi:uncharacterized protein LOC120353251 [Nilaparvata lugens]|uniref:uncharacterized protein LOC120353251 n=1 Tax=Nilaparvata lugens TaxID=108931 RepID=UPI00193EA4B7|nr:uncharacterized protein LOC120353251 [Nilaparvata lugens]